MKFLSCLLLLLISQATLAGGDYVSGKVSSFSEASGKYSLKFEQSDLLRPDLMAGCKTYFIQITHKRVPRFSWLPFVHSNHPTKEQTFEAAEFLQRAHDDNSEVQFGYMGDGLASTEDHCTFTSNGLRLFNEKDDVFVLSFSR